MFNLSVLTLLLRVALAFNFPRMKIRDDALKREQLEYILMLSVLRINCIISEIIALFET